MAEGWLVIGGMYLTWHLSTATFLAKVGKDWHGIRL
jgi:hypothetical protein